MSDNPRALELRVGIFVMTGIATIAIMAVQFGRMAQGLRNYYEITVEVPNANGLLKGSDVLLAGARIGHVSEKPAIAESIRAVSLRLKILDHIKLPKGARFEVGSSGLLGDRYVSVALPPDFDAAKFSPEDPAQIIPPGAVVQGSSSGAGLAELTEKGSVVMDHLKAELEKLQTVTEKLNTEVLSETNLQNIRQTFSNLKTSSEKFVEASDRVNTVLEEAKGTVARAGTTMEKVDAAAADLRLAITDGRKVLNSAREAVAKATSGGGPIATLLNDRQLAENLNALFVNLRRHGVLFYKDSAQRGGEVTPEKRPRSQSPAERR